MKRAMWGAPSDRARPCALWLRGFGSHRCGDLFGRSSSNRSEPARERGRAREVMNHGSMNIDKAVVK
eukprot:2292115-Pyramimonas_sp.AAC.1